MLNFREYKDASELLIISDTWAMYRVSTLPWLQNIWRSRSQGISIPGTYSPEYSTAPEEFINIILYSNSRSWLESQKRWHYIQKRWHNVFMSVINLWIHKQLKGFNSLSLMMPYGIRVFIERFVRWWYVAIAYWHQVITWTNVGYHWRIKALTLIKLTGYVQDIEEWL